MATGPELYGEIVTRFKAMAPLLDFLNAESEYRAVELNYVNLVGAYLTAAAQLNQAVGKEVMQ